MKFWGLDGSGGRLHESHLLFSLLDHELDVLIVSVVGGDACDVFIGGDT